MKNIPILIKALLCCGIATMVSSAQAALLWSPDLSEGSLAGAGLTSSAQNPPDLVMEITNANSESYFGTPDKNYIRMRAMETGTTRFIRALGVISEQDANPLSITSFNFVMKSEGSGSFSLNFHDANDANVASKLMEVRLNRASTEATTGRVNSITAASFNLDEAVNIQIYQNNTAGSVEYEVGSNLYSLDSGHYTVFLNDTIALNNTIILNAGEPFAKAGQGTGIRSISLSYFGTASGEVLIDDLSISSFSAIPEPSQVAMALAVFSLAIVSLVRRRAYRKQD